MSETLSTVLEKNKSLTGYEMEQLVLATLNRSGADEVDGAFRHTNCISGLNRDIATELYNSFFSSSTDGGFKPLKFVYYRIRIKDVYTIMRDRLMSPRGKDYFDSNAKTDDRLRQILTKKESIKGSELKKIVSNLNSKSYVFPDRESSDEERLEMSYWNFSKQMASYINTFFINCEKPLKNDTWYGVKSKEYGTATVYRDLEKSPRVNKTK